LTEPPPVDAEAGMEVYATRGERCRGMAKSRPEDFRVMESISLAGTSTEAKDGYFPLYRVEKKGIDTMHMARELSAELKGKVSFAGLKDSRAVAVQYVTPTSTRTRRPESVVTDRFRAELVGYLPKPLTRGSLVGNRFDVILRGCCSEVGPRLEEAVAAAVQRKVPNYFGLQRFGVGGAGTHRIGRALVLGDFRGAVQLILGSGRDGDIEKAVAKELERHPGGWQGALRRIHVRLRRLYVQAYQSFIFNRALSQALTDGEDISAYRKGDNWAELSEDGLVSSYPKSVKATPEGSAAPLMQMVGYAFRDYGSRFDAHVKNVLGDEGVSPGQFFIKEMQEISAEGGFRRPHLAIADPSWSTEGDTASLAFTLARGQYATVLLREILKPDDPVNSGMI
jgi:tRNA pseudouridine13 synthase